MTLNLSRLEPIDYLVIGHITQDMTRKYQLGGTASFSSLTSPVDGIRLVYSTSCSPEADLGALDGITVVRHASDQCTTFENLYVPRRSHSVPPPPGNPVGCQHDSNHLVEYAHRTACTHCPGGGSQDRAGISQQPDWGHSPGRLQGSGDQEGRARPLRLAGIPICAGAIHCSSSKH